VTSAASGTACPFRSPLPDRQTGEDPGPKSRIGQDGATTSLCPRAGFGGGMGHDLRFGRMHPTPSVTAIMEVAAPITPT